MTELTITPKIADKTARFKGAVAAGEHVAVTIKGGAEWLGDDNGEHLSLRVLDLVTGRTLAVFPRPEETYGEDEEYVPDEWSTAGEDDDDLFCNLNLNTDRMVAAARHMLRVPVLFVMGAKDEENPATTRTLYFRDRHEVEFWPERVGDDTPYDLDRWPKQIDEWTDLIAEFETRIDAAEDSIRDAVDEANGIVAHVDAAKTAAQNSATAAGDSASAAQGSAATAKNWATGGGETGDPGATNNAKYYAEQAGDSKKDAATSATSAAASATAAANSATAASGSATSAASSAQSAAGAAEAAVETEKERAEGAESDLADAIDAEKERAEGAEALAIVNAEYDGTSRRIVFTTGGGETKAIDASAFIKDGMISSVSVSNGNLVITFNSDAGRQPISIPLTQIFNPSNYYDKTAADGTFVKKDGAKALSTNDYTTAEKSKLAGIADGANNYTLPSATPSVLGGVKQGTGCTIAPDGTLNVTGGGGGETPVEPSTDASAQGKPADAKATGDALAEKRGVANFSVNGWVLREPGGGTVALGYISEDSLWSGGVYDLSFDNGTWSLSDAQDSWDVVASKNATSLTFTDGTSVYSLVRASRLAFDVEVSGKQDALSAQQLANIADVPNKAAAADLRYRIADAGYATTGARLPDNIAYVIADGTTYQASALTLVEGSSTYMLLGNDNVLGVEWDRNTRALIANPFNVVFYDSSDTPFSAVPNLLVPRTVADRTVNLITASDETSIDIELPAAVAVDGVRRARDFIFDIDNSAGASDLGLELASDATAYLDAGGAHYLVAVADGEDLADLLTVAAGKRARLYFTETAQTATPTGGTEAVPVIGLQRLTVTVGGAA